MIHIYLKIKIGGFLYLSLSRNGYILDTIYRIFSLKPSRSRDYDNIYPKECFFLFDCLENGTIT